MNYRKLVVSFLTYKTRCSSHCIITLHIFTSVLHRNAMNILLFDGWYEYLFCGLVFWTDAHLICMLYIWAHFLRWTPERFGETTQQDTCFKLLVLTRLWICIAFLFFTLLLFLIGIFFIVVVLQNCMSRGINGSVLLSTLP